MTKKEFIGFGSISHLPPILKRLAVKKIFLVTGRESYTTSGAQQWIDHNVNKRVTITHFQNFETNPKIKDVQRGITCMKRSRADVVIAIGGGSVLDMAKIINALAFQSKSPRAYIVGGEKIKPVIKPLVAIPTTAGTGSEATKFAVVYIGKTKYSLKHDLILPTYTIVDPQFTLHLPGPITAQTGMDAFCQAVESYWNIHSNTTSKKYAVKAIRLILKHLPVAVTAPTVASRAGMSIAANLAGKAINITATTACHAVSYPITSYFGIPHGHAVALTLGEMLEYNSHVSDPDNLDARGGEYVHRIIRELVHLIGASDVKQAKKILRSFMTTIGLATRLSALHIRRDNVETIVQHGFNPDRVKNNPRRLTKDALRKMLIRLL